MPLSIQSLLGWEYRPLGKKFIFWELIEDLLEILEVSKIIFFQIMVIVSAIANVFFSLIVIIIAVVELFFVWIGILDSWDFSNGNTKYYLCLYETVCS